MSGPEVPPLGAQRRADVSTPHVWGPVPLRNPDFVGRKQLLEQLHHRLKPGATAVLPEALHGMGGIGKTQVVVEYIHRHASEYDLVWWIPAEHPAQITASLVELAKKLGIPEAASADTAIPAVLDALRRGERPHSRWILVFDNADSAATVRQFIPAGTGHVVITSRDRGWAGVARPVEVNLFSRVESKQLLSRDNTLTDADADRLAKALGDLPLAVEQAAAWRAQTGMRPEEYLGLLEQNRTELLETGTSSDHQLPVAAAWNVPLNRLKHEHPAALQLLQLCAFFGPEPISRELFGSVHGVPVPIALAKALSDPITLHHAVKEISRYSLAKIDHDKNTLQLHPLVQTVLRDQLGSDERDGMRHAAHVLLAHGDPGRPESRNNWPRYRALLPHASMSRAVECPEQAVRRLMCNLVRYLHASGDYEGERVLSEQCDSAWREPGPAEPRRLFLSHSRKDDDRFVMALVKSLEDKGVEVWLDRNDMPVGRDIAEVVFEQINSADAFLVVVSGNTQDSDWVRREINMAVRRADRDPAFPVICVRLDEVDAPAALSGISAIKIDSSLDHLPHLEAMLRAIRRT